MGSSPQRFCPTAISWSPEAGPTIPIVLSPPSLASFFGPWWCGYTVDSVTLDGTQEWAAYMAPLAGDGKFYSPMSDPTTQYVCVRKGCEHPEAAVQIKVRPLGSHGVRLAAERIVDGLIAFLHERPCAYPAAVRVSGILFLKKQIEAEDDMAANTNIELRQKMMYSLFVRNHTTEGTFAAVASGYRSGTATALPCHSPDPRCRSSPAPMSRCSPVRPA